MKKLLLLSVIALTIMGCGNDDDSPQPTQDPIVGTWKLLETYVDGIQFQAQDCESDYEHVYQANATLNVTFDGNTFSASEIASDGTPDIDNRQVYIKQ